MSINQHETFDILNNLYPHQNFIKRSTVIWFVKKLYRSSTTKDLSKSGGKKLQQIIRYL